MCNLTEKERLEEHKTCRSMDCKPCQEARKSKNHNHKPSFDKKCLGCRKMWQSYSFAIG